MTESEHFVTRLLFSKSALKRLVENAWHKRFEFGGGVSLQLGEHVHVCLQSVKFGHNSALVGQRKLRNGQFGQDGQVRIRNPRLRLVGSTK